MMTLAKPSKAQLAWRISAWSRDPRLTARSAAARSAIRAWAAVDGVVNLGIVLLLFDRLFGTYIAEREDLPAVQQIKAATVKPIATNIQFTYIQNTNNKMQVGISQWYQACIVRSAFRSRA